MSDTATLLSFLLYIGVMLLVARVAWQRTTTLSDYILGGRRLGSLPSALSAGASDMSGWLLMGLPGLAYTAGLEAAWLALGLLAGTWLNWRLVARRLRRYSFMADDSVTLPAYFENRFHDTGHALRVISAVFILLFFLFYTTSGLVAGGKLFETVFGIPYTLAVVLIAVIAGLLALDPESRVLDLVAYAWAGFGAAFGPAALLSLFWRGMSGPGALAGIVVGGLTVVIWSRLNGGLFELYEILPGFLLSTLAIVLVSRLGPPPDATVKQGFDRFVGAGS